MYFLSNSVCEPWFHTPLGKALVGNYIPVRHDMMRQTNDCSLVWVMQHKVMYFLYLTQKILAPGRPRPLAGGPRAGSTWSSAPGSGPTQPQTPGFIT